MDQSPRTRIGVLMAGCLAGLVIGCSSGPKNTVRLTQFSNGTQPDPDAPPVVYTPLLPARDMPETLTIEPLSTTERPGTPESDGNGHESVSTRFEPVVYDAKIGDINGKPIIASEFLADLMPRLEADARILGEAGREQWRAKAGPIIARKLNDMIRDEVLYREGRSLLPESQRQGLLFFVDRVREELTRRAGGSETLAEKNILETENQTMDQFLESIERQRVIREVIDIAAEDFAPVSWLDIQNEYQKRYKEFNPDPRVFVRLITTRSQEDGQVVLDRLNAGEPFAEVASDPSLNSYHSDEGGMFNTDGTALAGELSEATIIGIPAINDELVQLEPGHWAGPIDRGGGRQSFVYFDRLEQQSLSIEDERVQLGLKYSIEQQRRERALSDYINRLRERANLGPERFSELVDRLLDVAETRVFGPER